MIFRFHSVFRTFLKKLISVTVLSYSIGTVIEIYRNKSKILRNSRNLSLIFNITLTLSLGKKLMGK